MKRSTIHWHLTRDTEAALGRFCSKQRFAQFVDEEYKNDEFFRIAFLFANNGYILAELRRGNKQRGYTVADHFRVVEFDLGEGAPL